MLVFRCTNKLLSRLQPAPEASDAKSTTALGAWYGNLVRVGSTQLVLFTSELSLLSVVLPAREVRKRLDADLRSGLGEVLVAVGVPSPLVVAELGEMEQYSVGRTASRKVLGHMNDFAFHLDAAFRMAPDNSLLQHSLELSQIPCGPVNYIFPVEQAKKLLAEAWGRRTRG